MMKGEQARLNPSLLRHLRFFAVCAPVQYCLLRFIDIQLERLTPMSELPRSGRMNLGRRFNAGAGALHPLRHVVTPEFN